MVLTNSRIRTRCFRVGVSVRLPVFLRIRKALSAAKSLQRCTLEAHGRDYTPIALVGMILLTVVLALGFIRDISAFDVWCDCCERHVGVADSFAGKPERDRVSVTCSTKRSLDTLRCRYEDREVRLRTRPQYHGKRHLGANTNHSAAGFSKRFYQIGHRLWNITARTRLYGTRFR